LGGFGDDSIDGGPDADTLKGGGGNDNIDGSEGNDSIRGELGDDFLFGDIGNDKLYGDEGNDTLSGGDGDDSFEGGTGDDLMIGGEGNDTVIYYISKTAFDLRVVDDRLQIASSSTGKDSLEEIETIVFSGRSYAFADLYAEAELLSHTELRVTILGPGKFALNEIRTGPIQAEDTSTMQVVQYDGLWTAQFREDARALLLWHQDKTNPVRNVTLDGLSLDDALAALGRGLVGREEKAFIELVGLIADCNIIDSIPDFNNDFTG